MLCIAYKFGMVRNSELFLSRKFTENTKFRRGGFYIRPLQDLYFRQIFCRTGFPSRENVIFLVVGYYIGVPLFWGRDLSVVPLCENFAHLRSLVFTFISHSRSNVVGLKRLSLRSAHFFAEDSYFAHKELAQFTFLGFTKLTFSYFVLPF